MRNIIKIMFIFALLFNCSEDKEETNAPEIIDGGTIAKFEVVHHTTENLLEETYQAVVNGNVIELVKSKENTLSFLCDDAFVIGENIVDIPGIDTKISYTVINTTLQNSVEETLEDLSSVFNNYVGSIEGLDNTPDELYVIQSIDNFNAALQQFSPQERESIALLYQANKAYFDTLYQIDYTIPQGKMSPDYSNLSNFHLVKNFAFSTIGAGVATASAILAASNPPLALVFAVTAIPLWQISKALFSEVKNRTFNYTTLLWDDIVSGNIFNKTMMQSIEFDNGVQKSINFDVSQRGISESDSNSSNPTFSTFFNAFDKFNSIIDKLNYVITIVNNIPFVDIDLIENEEVGNPQEETVDVEQDFLDHLTLSVSDSNLQMSDPVLNNGSLQLTMSIINEEIVSDYIETTLTYSFDDNDATSFTGSVPIKVFVGGDTGIDDTAILNELLSNSWYFYGYSENYTPVQYQKYWCSGEPSVGVSYIYNLPWGSEPLYFYENGTANFAALEANYGDEIIGNYSLNNGTLSLTYNIQETYENAPSQTLGFVGNYYEFENEYGSLYGIFAGTYTYTHVQDCADPPIAWTTSYEYTITRNVVLSTQLGNYIPPYEEVEDLF